MREYKELNAGLKEMTTGVYRSIRWALESLSDEELLKIPIADDEIKNVITHYGIVDCTPLKNGKYYNIYFCFPSIFRDEFPTQLTGN